MEQAKERQSECEYSTEGADRTLLSQDQPSLSIASFSNFFFITLTKSRNQQTSTRPRAGDQLTFT
jgi:hypothetical protein